MELEGYELEPGCNSDLVILQAVNPIEVIQLKANRLLVIKSGKVIARAPVQESFVALKSDEEQPVNFSKRLF